MKTLIVYYSTYGHVYRKATHVAEGVKEIPDVEPVVRRVAEQGGLISYAPDYPDLFRRAAVYVDKILKRVRPGDLPVEQPQKFELIVTAKTARALGLTIPSSLLTRADLIIQ
jgi:ABC-type uncharacterized transport system substrate-binding protein